MRHLNSYIDIIAPRVLFEADGSNAEDILPYVTKFEYETDAAKSSQLKITVANQNFRFTEDKRLKAGVKFKFCWGYPLDMSPVITATVVKAKPTFPGSGMPTIELVAFDLRYEMTVGSDPKNYGQVSSSEVARKIAEKHGLKIDIDESGDASKTHRIQPITMNDFTFLGSLAAKIHYACYVDNEVLHFHKYRTNARPGLEFMYYTDDRSNIIEFVPEINMNKPSGVKAVGATPGNPNINADGKTPEDFRKDGSYNINRLRDNMSGLKGRLSKVIGAHYDGPSFNRDTNRMMLPSASLEKNELASQAAGLSQKLDMAALKASMKVIGTPKLKANMMIRVLGVGSEYSGNWYVTTAKHVISPTGTVYVTELKLSKDAPNAKNKNKDSAGADGHKSTIEGDVGYGRDPDNIVRIDENGNIASKYGKRGTTEYISNKRAVR